MMDTIYENKYDAPLAIFIDRLSVICENSAASELEQSSTFQMCSVFDTAMKSHFQLFDTGVSY